jgi:integrase
LSALAVKTAKPKEGQTSRFLGDGGNLWLQCTVGEGGHVRKNWTFRYQLRGMRREMGLGAVHTVSLAEARDKARALRQQLLDGIDPLDLKHDRIAQQQREKQERAAEVARRKTFGEVTKLFLVKHENSWRSAVHRRQWINTLADYAKPINDLCVGDITTAHVVSLITPIWDAKRVTARRVINRIERVLDYAISSGFRPEGPNPARWKNHLQNLLPSERRRVEHHAALPYADIPALMAELRADGSLAARALELCVLTCARTAELLGASLGEFDLDAALWTVPPDRMKAHKEHRVPLCARAVEIVRSLPAPLPFGGLHMKAMRVLLQRLRLGTTPHGCRSSFRDWAEERTSYPRVVVEQALAHSIGSEVEKAYRRTDLLAKRRRLMTDWAKFCASPPAAGAETNVTPLRTAGHA